MVRTDLGYPTWTFTRGRDGTVYVVVDHDCPADEAERNADFARGVVEHGAYELLTDESAAPPPA